MWFALLSGETGRFLYRLTSDSTNDVNYDQKCVDWYYSQNMFLIDLQVLLAPSCPCDRQLARFDRRWQMDVELALTGSSMECYYQRFLSFTTATHVRHALVTSVDYVLKISRIDYRIYLMNIYYQLS